MAVQLATHVPKTSPNDGVIDAAKKALGNVLLEARDAVGEITLVVARESIASALKMLRDTPGLEYQQLMEIAGVDYPDRAERFEVVYHLHSIERNERLRLKARLAGNAPSIESVTTAWRGANWYEREIFDLFGIRFTGHPDLRRIMMPDDWEGHPLRKDYPVEASPKWWEEEPA